MMKTSKKSRIVCGTDFSIHATEAAEVAAALANYQSAQAQADINARAAELQQNERLKGRELDLQAARDQATKEYQSGQLALGYAEMGSRERVAANELASREKLQQQAQEFQAGQNAKDRALREAIQLSETTGKQYIVDDRGNVVPKLDANGRQMETSAAEQSRLSREQQASQFSATQAAADKDRALREAMAMSESTGLQYTVGPDGRVTQVLKDGKPVPTSAAEQARLSREQQANQFTATQAAAEKDRLFRESVARSEQTGFQHTVDDRGNVVPVRDKDGNIKSTSNNFFVLDSAGYGIRGVGAASQTQIYAGNTNGMAVASGAVTSRGDKVQTLGIDLTDVFATLQAVLSLACRLGCLAQPAEAVDA